MTKTPKQIEERAYEYGKSTGKTIAYGLYSTVRDRELGYIAGYTECSKDMEAKWISVEDRLPQDMKDVLFCNVRVESEGVETVSQG